MQQAVSRALLLSAALFFVGTLAVQVAGDWFLSHPSEANLERGVRWNSGNGSLWTVYARRLLSLSEGGKSPEAVQAYRHAVALNPFDLENWNGLATAYEQMADVKRAEAALRAALIAIPRSPQLAWRFANFLIQQGRTEEALPYLRTTAAYHRSLRLPVFDMVWKLLVDPERIFQEVVPAELEARADYLGFLLNSRRLAETYPVWSQIRAGRAPFVISMGHTYVEALAASGMGQEAARVWSEILQDTGRSEAKPPGALLTNGDFEYGLAGAGLDWRLTKGPGYQSALEQFEFHHGSHSLRFVFDGSSNPDFAGAQQWVPVQPNRRYRFRGYLKTDSISTDSGLRFSISSVATPPEEAFVYLTENRVGTMPWVQEEADFQTGPHTQVILIALRRVPSRKLNNLLQGKVWIDELSLTLQLD